VIERLPSKFEALRSNPNTTKKTKKEKGGVDGGMVVRLYAGYIV
jgi:hypothetical protein